MQGRRWQQEDTQKLQEARARVYAELWSLMKMAGYYPHLRADDNWYLRITRAFTEMEMYGTRQTAGTARQVLKFLNDEGNDAEKRSEDWGRRFRKLEDELKQAVRADLGIDLEDENG